MLNQIQQIFSPNNPCHKYQYNSIRANTGEFVLPFVNQKIVSSVHDSSDANLSKNYSYSQGGPHRTLNNSPRPAPVLPPESTEDAQTNTSPPASPADPQPRKMIHKHVVITSPYDLERMAYESNMPSSFLKAGQIKKYQIRSNQF